MSCSPSLISKLGFNFPTQNITLFLKFLLRFLVRFWGYIYIKELTHQQHNIIMIDASPNRSAWWPQHIRVSQSSGCQEIVTIPTELQVFALNVETIFYESAVTRKQQFHLHSYMNYIQLFRWLFCVCFPPILSCSIGQFSRLSLSTLSSSDELKIYSEIVKLLPIIIIIIFISWPIRLTSEITRQGRCFRDRLENIKKLWTIYKCVLSYTMMASQ